MSRTATQKAAKEKTEELIMLRKSILLTGAAALLSSQLLSADARVTVAHFAPFATDIADTSVSVVLNGAVALENVVFKTFTDYIDLPAGEYKVDIVPTGTDIIAITNTWTLVDGQDYTVYATGNGSLQPLELVALADDNTAPAAGNIKVRIVHTAPFGPTPESTEVSVRTAGGALVAGPGVPYGAATGYLELPAATYDLKVASNNGQVNLIDPLPVPLPEGAIVTLFAVGDIINQSLGIVATPVAELPLRTPVDQSTNGSYLLDGFDGQGFWFTPIPSQNRAVGAWYTYNADGSPMWFTFESEAGGFDGMTATTTLYQSSGMTEGEMQMTMPVGTIDFNVVDCGMIEATVTVGDSVTDYDGLRLTQSASCAPEG
jgi:hypothetical protein